MNRMPTLGNVAAFALLAVLAAGCLRGGSTADDDVAEPAAPALNAVDPATDRSTFTLVPAGVPDVASDPGSSPSVGSAQQAASPPPDTAPAADSPAEGGQGRPVGMDPEPAPAPAPPITITEAPPAPDECQPEPQLMLRPPGDLCYGGDAAP